MIRTAVRLLVAFATGSAAAAATAGCRPGTRDRSSSDAAPRASPAGSPPTDHLADGELLEGDGRAFDLPLPRGLRVKGSFADVVFASGPLLLDPLVQYFRPRLAGGDLHEGRETATFEHTQVAKKPGHKLTIHIAEVRQEARVEIRDETPPPAPDLPDEAARWRHVGLTSDGRLADPTHLN